MAPFGQIQTETSYKGMKEPIDQYRCSSNNKISDNNLLRLFVLWELRSPESSRLCEVPGPHLGRREATNEVRRESCYWVPGRATALPSQSFVMAPCPHPVVCEVAATVKWRFKAKRSV